MMPLKLRGIAIVLIVTAAVFYPGLIFYFLVIQKIDLRMFSLFVMAFALLAFIAGTSKNKKKQGLSFFWNFLLLFGLGALCLIVNSVVILKLYPLLMNVLFLAAFSSTLFFPPAMVFRFAVMQDKSIQGSLNEKKINAYCRKITLIWCIFFVLNGSMAAYTIFSGSDVLWSAYNGGVSYILMGALFAGEYIARKMMQKKMPRAVPLSVFKHNSRPLSTVLCYEGYWGASVYKTWGDFLEGTARLRRQINAAGGRKWLLHCEDCWYFLLAFTALLQCKKEILLSANISPSYIAEIRNAAPFLTDQDYPKEDYPANTFHIPSLFQKIIKTAAPTEEGPVINADETSIIMYTSGSTGKPKAIKQRLTEFENDNRFVLSKWGEEFLKRKVCSTVSQHHIYGLLFSILLPFTAGVPFKRKRIEFPEELEKLSDTKYMIITVPAFLKRAAEIEKLADLSLTSPWIFTSGGVLDPGIAEKTCKIFGFWPVEVYGSTETSGVAWRQSAQGLEWTAFKNAKLDQNQDGCLVIRSPYIKDPAGFETADLVEILEDGRFLLKGRIDSVVKIEEKRISLPEIENRILQSGLAADVCVIFLEDKRQYLAAAVVFNSKGKERFSGLEKHQINKFWREYLIQYFENIVIPKKWRYPQVLPSDIQGKKKKEEIVLLFSNQKNPAESIGFGSLDKEKIIEKTENAISLEFSIPNSSPYFEGHFPEFPILPAVAQVELILRLASRYLGTGIGISEIRRIKFSNLIRPFTPLHLKLEKKGKIISFKMSSPASSAGVQKNAVSEKPGSPLEKEIVYSAGTLMILEEENGFPRKHL
ncbi:MAG: AMP-binding protein [Treponema sp.]|nr:AMP-binding protein [Treponema sp.]